MVWLFVSMEGDIPNTQCLVNQKYVVMAAQIMQISKQDSQQTNVIK